MVYVDRVVHYNREVKRGFPTIHGWTAPILRQRQKSEIENGGFGFGFLEDRIDVNEELLKDDMPEASNEDDECDDATEQNENEKKPDKDADETYTDEVISCLSDAATKLAEFLEKVKKAPPNVVQNPRFKAAIETSKFLIHDATSSKPADAPSVAATQNPLDDDPEWEECLNNMMDVWDMMQDFPSFNFEIPAKVKYKLKKILLIIYEVFKIFIFYMYCFYSVCRE